MTKGRVSGVQVVLSIHVHLDIEWVEKIGWKHQIVNSINDHKFACNTIWSLILF